MNLTIYPGITGIVGPNGAGKSTFFKLVMGLIKPRLGEINVLGENPWKNSGINSKIGFCPDYDSLPLDSTGHDYLKLIASLHGVKDREFRVSEVTKTVEMSKDSSRKIGGYSKGMKQRIKIASALIPHPEMLILDEPLAGTDPLVRRKLIELIESLHKDSGYNIIVSSHILREVERMTREIALFYKGRAIASGNISEIRALINKHPHNIVIKGKGTKELAKGLLDESYVISVRLIDEGISVEVNDPDGFFTSIPNILANMKVSIDEMYSLDDSLDAVFEYLVEG
ncbi:MAG: ABC transporter ATP-binding protein [Candidatus Peribacteraceae bacterium]|nr:ABC transporter ATP-binding protein [Candidatus Peribacteraceae bacterium]